MKTFTFRSAAGSILFVSLALAGCGGDGHHARPLYTPSAMSVPDGILSSAVYNAGGDSAVGFGLVAGNHSHALVFPGPSHAGIDLQPSGFDSSLAAATDGNVVVGIAYNGQTGHAMRWDGTSSTPVDLNPSGYDGSVAAGIGGDLIVGDVTQGTNSFAVVWTGSSNAPTFLPVPGYTQSNASAIVGDTIAGNGEVGGNSHALIWHGLSSNPVDLHPAGYTESFTTGTDGTHTVGTGEKTSVSRARPLLWTGDSNQAVDLTPSGYDGGGAERVLNGRIVGTIYKGTTTHACVWDDNGAVFTDLHALLSNLRINGQKLQADYSAATGIDAQGNIYGYAIDSTKGGGYSIVWKHR